MALRGKPLMLTSVPMTKILAPPQGDEYRGIYNARHTVDISSNICKAPPEPSHDPCKVARVMGPAQSHEDR